MKEEFRMTDSKDDELLAELRVQIERAWNAGRNDALVDRLAGEHPELAEELYLFFADVVAMTLEPNDPRPELATADDRTRKWLESEGYRRVAEAYQESKASTTLTPTGRSLLGMLKDTTHRSTNALAASLEISSAFLLDLSQHAELVPETARLELARRVEKSWGISQANTLLTLRQPPDTAPRQRAASRSAVYQPSETTYEAMVRRSGLDDRKQRYWLSLE
jgi:hypothetical protein